MTIEQYNQAREIMREIEQINSALDKLSKQDVTLALVSDSALSLSVSSFLAACSAQEEERAFLSLDFSAELADALRDKTKTLLGHRRTTLKLMLQRL